AVLKQPARSQRLHVGAVDLIDGRVPRAGQIEIVQRPVDRRLRRPRLRGDCRSGERDENPDPLHFEIFGSPNVAASIATFTFTSSNSKLSRPSSHAKTQRNGNLMPPTSR